MMPVYEQWTRFGILLVAMGLAWPSVSRSGEALPPGTKIVSLEAFPAQISLKTDHAYRQLLLTGVLDNGQRIDATRLARLQQQSKLLNCSDKGLVRPVADGRETLVFETGGQKLSVGVEVSGLNQTSRVSFVQDVMPVISKIGCNAGTCHGAQKGKNGFKLSLRGYDPLLDHQALTDDLEGRRFNRAAPERSLMLLKPSGGVPHQGGMVIQPEDPYYRLIRGWIAQGVKLDLNSPRVTSLEVFPKSVVVPLPGFKQQTAVLATYADGSVRDVSAEAFVESSNTEVATVDKQGLMTAVRRGEATMLARYEGAYAASNVVVMGDRQGYVWRELPEYNYIDKLVDEKLRQVKVLPSDLCSDYEFVRRIYLDLTGLPPLTAEVRAFIDDARPSRTKREALIDKLVGSEDFVEYWTNKWADLLQVNRKYLGERGALAWRNWIKLAVATNLPYDKFVYRILTASGSTLENPPASYYKVLREPALAMENTTQLFLAIRFNCNKCHDHPFERWTQDQYYHLAAYFARVTRKDDPHYKNQKVGGTDVEQATALAEIVYDQSQGEVKHERTGVVSSPEFPFTHKDLLPKAAARREQLSHWLVSRDNPYFAKSYVNRIWSYLLGVGIIEPVDDIRAGNPPSNPKLLDSLTEDFLKSNLDVQHMFRTICKSRVYQQSITTDKWNQDDDLNYSHALARRLTAEALYDAIHRVTGTVSRLEGMPAGLRAAQQIDSKVEVPSGFLDLFGRPARESACECERTGSMMLGPVLNLVNGPVLADAIRDPEGFIAKLVAKEPDDSKVIEQIFLTMLSRPATPEEIKSGVRALHGETEEYIRMTAEHEKLRAASDKALKELPARQDAWEKTLKAPDWVVLEPAAAISKAGTVLTRQPDGSLLASGKNPTPEVYTVTARTTLQGMTAFRLEVLADDRLPGRGPGRAENGNFVLNEFRISAAPIDAKAKPAAVALGRAVADHEQEDYAVGYAIDGQAETGWAIVPATGRSHTAIFEAKAPVGFSRGTLLTFELEQNLKEGKHNIGRFRLSATRAKPPIKLERLPDAIAHILAISKDRRSLQQATQLAGYYRGVDPELAHAQEELARHPLPPDVRLLGAQDLSWALLNSPAFLFNH